MLSPTLFGGREGRERLTHRACNVRASKARLKVSDPGLVLHSVAPSALSIRLGIDLEMSQQHLQPPDKGGDRHSSAYAPITEYQVWLY